MNRSPLLREWEWAANDGLVLGQVLERSLLEPMEMKAGVEAWIEFLVAEVRRVARSALMGSAEKVRLGSDSASLMFVEMKTASGSTKR